MVSAGARDALPSGYCMWKNVPGVGYESQVFASGTLPAGGFE